MCCIQLQLIELQFDSHVQARVVEGALQGRGVRNSITFEGCTLASQSVALKLRAQLCFRYWPSRISADCVGRNCTPRWALMPTKTTLTCEICLRNDAAQSQESVTKAASGQTPFAVWVCLCFVVAYDCLMNSFTPCCTPAAGPNAPRRSPLHCAGGREGGEQAAGARVRDGEGWW